MGAGEAARRLQRDHPELTLDRRASERAGIGTTSGATCALGFSGALLVSEAGTTSRRCASSWRSPSTSQGAATTSCSTARSTQRTEDDRGDVPATPRRSAWRPCCSAIPNSFYPKTAREDISDYSAARLRVTSTWVWCCSRRATGTLRGSTRAGSRCDVRRPGRPADNVVAVKYEVARPVCTASVEVLKMALE